MTETDNSSPYQKDSQDDEILSYVTQDDDKVGFSWGILIFILIIFLIIFGIWSYLYTDKESPFSVRNWMASISSTEKEEFGEIAEEEKQEFSGEEVSNVRVDLRPRQSDYLVIIEWTPSEGATDHYFYRSTDGGATWDAGKRIGPKATKMAQIEQPESEIHYKITTKDSEGNESEGIIESVKVPVLMTDEESEAGEETEATPNEEEEAPEDPKDFIAEPVEEEEEKEKDTTAPEDISNLKADYRAQEENYLVTLKWTPSVDSAGDLDDQLFYRSETEGKKWEEGESLGAKAIKTTQEEAPETEISYKITTKDTSGNESAGVIRDVKLPALTKTGTGDLIIFSILIGIGLRVLMRNRRV